MMCIIFIATHAGMKESMLKPITQGRLLMMSITFALNATLKHQTLILVINMSDYKFTLPYPPSINSYWATFKGRRITTKRGREYVKLVAEKMLELKLHSEMIGCDVNFSMIINPPTLRKYDVDNFTKGVFDALTKCNFWIDDDQVQQLTVKKGEKVKGGNVEIIVTCLNGK